MVKLILGRQGSGKTKRLVDLVCEAVAMDNGDVVCIEREQKLTYDIPYKARLIETGAYGICSYDLVKGFLCGLHSGNYDITHVFIDNFLKIVNDKEAEGLLVFLEWLKLFSEKESIDFVISVSIDPEKIPEAINEYVI